MTIDARTIIGTAAGSVSFEGLEGRQLMSGVGFSNNTLTITGSNANDDIRVTLSNDGKTISAKLNNGAARSFKAANVYAINVDTGQGHNFVAFDGRITANADIKSSEGNDTITTGAGNDRIRTAGGNDVINAGSGNDYVESAGGNDLLQLGAGNDKAVAGEGRDLVQAGPGKDAVFGQGGDDVITGKSGDSLDGGAGKNTIARNGTGSSGGTNTNTNTNTNPNTNTSSSMKVRKLSLVNADTGAVISGYGTLTNGMTLDLSKLPKNITIVAEMDGKVESAKFSMSDGSAGRVDDSSSYSLTSSYNGAYSAWSMSNAKSVQLSVTPYAADGAAGTAGATKTLTLNIKRASTTTPTNNNSQPTNTSTGVNAPKIKINAIQTTVTAGQAFFAEATQTTVSGGQVEDASFSWNFGDPTGDHNAMPGFNASHVYDRPGKYTAKLTVTSPNGQSSTQTFTVNVVAANYKTIYVSNSGSDNNNGSSQGKSVKSLAKAVELSGNNAQILLKRGETFQLKSGVNITKNNVVVSSYGNGSNPTLMYTGARSGFHSLISVSKSSQNVTIRGLTFNSIYSSDGDQNGLPQAIVAGGTSVTVRENNFLNVAFAVNANHEPKGLLVMDNKAPLAGGLRAYFVWAQGSDLVIVGNTVANSTREHVVRVWGTDRLNISYNDFANIDRRGKGDQSDYAKGVIVTQKGSFAYVAYNDLRGPVGVGPLGEKDGLISKGSRFKHAAFEGNILHNQTIDVHHGAEHVTLRGNTSHMTGNMAYKVEGFNNSYGRGVRDLVIHHNVAINNGEAGNFLMVQGKVDGITLTDNVYVAPYLKPGGYGTAAVYVNDNNLNSFRRIDGNVWPSGSRGSSYARGGVMVLGTSYSSNNHRTHSEWNAMSVVGHDDFADVSTSNAMKITQGGTVQALRRAA